MNKCKSCKYYRPATVHWPADCNQGGDVKKVCELYVKQPLAWLRNFNWRMTA